mmetsp:Transcript_94461/g.262832  ORF Transcript_94461/g.262832 Transcript_94461/m.262832 type:complete len:437 (-) Transcript_94461:507-1817(-)
MTSHVRRSSGQVLSVEDPEGLLQRLDLGLAPRHAVLVAHAGVDARGLELVEVRECGVKLLLRPLQVLPLDCEGLRLVLLFCRLVLNVLCLCCLVHCGVGHERVVLLLSGSLRGLRVSLKAGEVRLDHLQHADHASVLGLHALVGRGEDLRRRRLLLDERGRIGRLLVELLQDVDGLRHRGLRGLGINDSLLVLGALVLAELRALGHLRVEVCHSLGQLGDVLGQLGNGRLQLIDLGVQNLHGLRLLLPRLLVRGKLRVAPALVLGLLVGLLHQPDEEVLDHFPDLDEGIVGHAPGGGGEHAALQRAGTAFQEARRAQLRPALHLGPQCGQRRAALEQGRQVLPGVARDVVARDDLDGLGDGRELVRPEGLPRLEVRGLLLARRREVAEVLLVSLLRGGRAFEVGLGLGLGLQLLGPRPGLLAAVLLGLFGLRPEVL